MTEKGFHSYHPHLSARNYYTRVHGNGAAGDGDGARG